MAKDPHYGFRARGADESADAYREALIAHLRQFDLLAAHELRLGKPQASWTTDEVEAWRREITTAGQGPPLEFGPGMRAFPMDVLQLKDGLAPSYQTLYGLAVIALDTHRRRRIAEPETDLVILVSVLLQDGTLLSTSPPHDDRVALLRHIATALPVYGFLVAADTYLHLIEGHVATRRDALLVHVATRDERAVLIRPYTVTTHGVVFDDPPPPDLDVAHIEDPYAFVFTTTPEGRVPS